MNRLVDAPDLVGVQHQLPFRPDRLAQETSAAQVGLQVTAHFELEVHEAGRHRLGGQLPDLLVGVAEPSRRSGVRRIAVFQHRGLPSGSAGREPAQHLDCLRAGQRIVDVAEIDASDQLLGRHVRQQLPERLAFDLGVQVPHGIDQGRGRKVHDALLRTQPSKLAVCHQRPPESGHVGGDVFERVANHVPREQVDRRHADLGTAPDGEGEPVAGEAIGVVRVQHDVGSRIIGIFVHGIRPVQRPGRREPDVTRRRPQDPRTHLGSELYAKAPMFVNQHVRRPGFGGADEA